MTAAVLIVEDHDLVRIGLRMSLTQQGFQVFGEADDGPLALELLAAAESLPDIVLMDITLKTTDGIEITRAIKQLYPSLPVLMLSAQENETQIFAALAAGANGYCVKNVNAFMLANAVSSIVTGAVWLHPSIAQKILKVTTGVKPAARAPAVDIGLTPPELEVLNLIVTGLSNVEIAGRLGISAETAKTHVRHITEKLAVSDRTQAAVKAMRAGMV